MCSLVKKIYRNFIGGTQLKYVFEYLIKNKICNKNVIIILMHCDFCKGTANPFHQNLKKNKI